MAGAGALVVTLGTRRQLSVRMGETRHWHKRQRKAERPVDRANRLPLDLCAAAVP